MCETWNNICNILQCALLYYITFPDIIKRAFQAKFEKISNILCVPLEKKESWKCLNTFSTKKQDLQPDFNLLL